jgi:hypothetical protein
MSSIPFLEYLSQNENMAKLSLESLKNAASELAKVQEAHDKLAAEVKLTKNNNKARGIA